MHKDFPSNAGRSGDTTTEQSCGFREVTYLSFEDEAYVHVDQDGTISDLYMHHDSDWIESSFVAGVSRWRKGRNPRFSHAEHPAAVLAYLSAHDFVKEEEVDAD